MSKLLFSHSYYYRLDPKQWKNKTPFPPLGTLYAASLLRKNGHQVKLFDTNLIESPESISPVIESFAPHFLILYDDGFNYLTKMCLTNMRQACFEMIRIGKQKDCIVVICSSDSTDHAAEYLENGADYIILGEGEHTLLELIQTLEQNQDPSAMPGIAFQNSALVQLNARRPVLQDLDELPFPAWDLVDIDAYKKVWRESGQPFTLNIATTRGCPYKCNWCAKPIYGNRYNSHSADYVARHLAFLSLAYGVKRFWMCDDIFGLKPNWVAQFNESVKARELKIRYYIQSRVDLLLKENMIDLLAESGLEEVWVGAESASQKILDAMDKGTSVNQIYEATKLLKTRNIRVAFFLQFGYLGENEKDISKTIEMVKELLPDNIGVSVSYPLPGTKFYEKVKQDLRQKANWKDSDDMDLMFEGTFKTRYYRRLQRFVHKEFRKSHGMYNLKKIVRNPTNVSLDSMISVAKLAYYIPSAFVDTILLKRMAHG